MSKPIRVSPLYRRWPWLASRKARKDLESAYAGAVRQARIVTAANVGFMVLNVATHQVFFIVVTVIGLSQSTWQCWSLPRHREAFLVRRSALKELVADFEQRWLNGTWTGAHPSESALIAIPVGTAVGLWHHLLVAPESPPAQSLAVGIVAGLLLALRHVLRRPLDRSVFTGSQV